MRVLLLGGTGLFYKKTATLLVRESLITEIGHTSRNLECAQSTSPEVGHRDHAMCVYAGLSGECQTPEHRYRNRPVSGNGSLPVE
jgi:hypothetical protein